LVEPHRRELRAHCYRMSGSLHDADDLLQEGMIRAWKGLRGYEGRASLRTWLYKVATSACLDALDKKDRKVLPADLGPAGTEMVGPRLEPIWLEPCPEDVWTATPSSPEARYDARESVALALLTALQLLPPKQRAVLILRDVVGMEASECAELLETSVASVNSALQRARDALESRGRPERHVVSDGVRALLSRYVRAWEESDVSALVALLHEDATLQMPPLPAWLHGAKEIGESIGAMVFTPGTRGAFKLVPTEANGLPAFAAYAGGKPLSIQVIEVRGDRIHAITAFGDPSLFPHFATKS